MIFQTVPFADNKRSVYLNDYPDLCPACHKQITPNYNGRVFTTDEIQVSAVLTCPNPHCESSFIAVYYLKDNMTHFYFNHIFMIKPQMESYSDEIETLSPQFTKIYNEAYFAEQNKLLEICGVGYRKALEFLIKDYLIKKFPDKEEEIKSTLLGKCIKDFVQDTRIKETSKRAVWLGNDHTHYVKKWESKDLSDLKLLIKLSVNWVESEIMTEALINSMAE